MIIGFYVPMFYSRGTDTALFNYAIGNRDVLGNESIILYKTEPTNNMGVTMKKIMTDNFDCIHVRSPTETAQVCRAKGISVIYTLTDGITPNELNFKNKRQWFGVKTVEHLVFGGNITSADRIAFVSQELQQRTKINLPVVPHIVTLPNPADIDVREKLGIPKESLVIGRHGGYETFDIDFVKKTVVEHVKWFPNVHYIFMNTQRFINHKRVHFIPGTANQHEVSSFIKVCDCMIHARTRGETFGLSIAEFSFHNKPIITYGKSIERNHLDLLNGLALVYNNEEDLVEILTKLPETLEQTKDWRGYIEYTPEKIMKVFEKVFISS
jgi:glycosyltransferase involved in cell wall biosynthesis